MSDDLVKDNIEPLLVTDCNCCGNTHVIGWNSKYVTKLQADREQAAAEERAKIVAWLRSRDQLEDCYSELQEDWLSNRIEAGEYETFTHPDNV